MWSVVKKVVLGLIVAIVLVSAAGGIYVYRTVNRDIEEHFAGTCESFELDGSAEDILFDRERGFAYLSVADRGGVARGEDIPQGTILRVDLNGAIPKVSPALITRPSVLYPHGISLFIDEQGQRYLFSVNHPKNRGVDPEAVELFIESAPGEFEHAETFRDPLIARPNDLVAVGPREFYVANDTGQARDAPEFVNVIYHDGDNAEIVADDVRSGGGINVSLDGSTIYVAETNGQAVRVFERNDDGSLNQINRIALGSSPDNIDIAEDGSLWIGAHSNLMALVMHFIMGSDAPTQVLRVNVAESTDPIIEEIYLDRGDEISSGSVGASFGDLLLIGSITEKKFLVCQFDPGAA